jgi:hypothetical protein
MDTIFRREMKLFRHEDKGSKTLGTNRFPDEYSPALYFRAGVGMDE